MIFEKYFNLDSNEQYVLRTFFSAGCTQRTLGWKGGCASVLCWRHVVHHARGRRNEKEARWENFCRLSQWHWYMAMESLNFYFFSILYNLTIPYRINSFPIRLFHKRCSCVWNTLWGFSVVQQLHTSSKAGKTSENLF